MITTMIIITMMMIIKSSFPWRDQSASSCSLSTTSFWCIYSLHTIIDIIIIILLVLVLVFVLVLVLVIQLIVIFHSRGTDGAQWVYLLHIT